MENAKLDRNGYAPSILQDDTSFCYAEIRAAVSPRWQVLQELPPEELADFLARELDDGLPVDWNEWLREWVQLPHE